MLLNKIALSTGTALGLALARTAPADAVVGGSDTTVSTIAPTGSSRTGMRVLIGQVMPGLAIAVMPSRPSAVQCRSVKPKRR